MQLISFTVLAVLGGSLAQCKTRQLNENSTVLESTTNPSVKKDHAAYFNAFRLWEMGTKNDLGVDKYPDDYQVNEGSQTSDKTDNVFYVAVSVFRPNLLSNFTGKPTQGAKVEDLVTTKPKKAPERNGCSTIPKEME